MEERPPAMEGNWEYTEQTVVDRQCGVVSSLQLGCEADNPLP
jgi:hypothetical protein